MQPTMYYISRKWWVDSRMIITFCHHLSSEEGVSQFLPVSPTHGTPMLFLRVCWAPRTKNSGSYLNRLQEGRMGKSRSHEPMIIHIPLIFKMEWTTNNFTGIAAITITMENLQLRITSSSDQISRGSRIFLQEEIEGEVRDKLDLLSPIWNRVPITDVWVGGGRLESQKVELGKGTVPVCSSVQGNISVINTQEWLLLHFNFYVWGGVMFLALWCSWFLLKYETMASNEFCRRK